jgi:hypothetical protein
LGGLTGADAGSVFHCPPRRRAHTVLGHHCVERSVLCAGHNAPHHSLISGSLLKGRSFRAAGLRGERAFLFLSMKQLRWQILVVLVTLGIVAVLLFSQQSPSITGPILPQPEQGGVYTEGLVGSLGRLNPLLDWNNSADRDVDRLLFSGLVRFDERGMPQADLAEAWGVAQDGTVYNFSIRPNAVWHDGEPVTSDDVIFTIEMIKGVGSLYPQDIKDLWSKIEVTRLNDKNLKFTLPEPFVPFMDYLTFGVLPKHLLESVPPEQMANAEFNINPVGTDPISSITCSWMMARSQAWCWVVHNVLS